MKNTVANLQNTINWDDLRLLLAVSRHASLLDAGRNMGVATTTMSRRISKLESTVKAQLINRTHAGTLLTDAGQKLVQALEPIASGIEACLRDSFGADSQLYGVIKLSIAEGLLPYAIEAIQSFRVIHPGVAFELDTANRLLNISQSEADIVLRTVKPSSEGLVVRRVATMSFGVYLSSQMQLQTFRQRPEDVLVSSDAVILGGELAGLKESTWLRSRTRAVSLQVGSISAVIDAVRRGIGIGVIPDQLIANNSDFQRLCDCEAVKQRTLWLIMNTRSSKTRRVREFADHITEHLRRI